MQTTEIKDWLQIASFAVAIIGGLIGLFFLIKKETRARTRELDEQLSGHWTNEGNIGGEIDPQIVDLELSAKARQVEGILSVRSVSSSTHCSNLSVIGSRLRKRVAINFIYVRAGNVQTVGRAMLRLKKGNIQWRLRSGTADFFPKKVDLFKTDREGVD